MYSPMPVVTMSIEALHDTASEITERVQVPSDSLTIFQGLHPTKGQITIVIPPLGDGLLMLPSVPA